MAKKAVVKNLVTPILTFDNSGDGCPVYSIPGSQICECETGRGCQRTNFFNRLWRQFCLRMSGATNPATTSLTYFVGRVVDISSELQVLRVYAWGIITRMHDHHSLRDNHLMVQFVNYLRRVPQFSVDSDTSVAGGIFRTRPQPACVLVPFDGLRIKTFLNSSSITKLIGKCISSHTVHCIINMGKCQEKRRIWT
jgi:hypothetical protein